MNCMIHTISFFFTRYLKVMYTTQKIYVHKGFGKKLVETKPKITKQTVGKQEDIFRESEQLKLGSL